MIFLYETHELEMNINKAKMYQMTKVIEANTWKKFKWKKRKDVCGQAAILGIAIIGKEIFQLDAVFLNLLLCR